VSAPQIEVEDLRKHFRVQRRAPGLAASIKALFQREHRLVRAVDGVSFSVAKGERVGFLGPNGAGKTTTLKMLSGLLYPSSGSVRVGGRVPQHREEEFLEQIMLVMGQKHQLVWDLPPSDTFELNRAIYQVPRPQYEETIGELTELLDLGDLVNKPTRELSHGERMKCELVVALIHRPKVLFLDEPTIGLDVTTQAVVRSFVREYCERHDATLLLTSHYMDDVAALCPRVIVINDGRLGYDGSLDALVRQIKPEKRLTLLLREAPDLAAIERIGPVVEAVGNEVVIQVQKESLAGAVSGALATLDVLDFTVSATPLEEVMAELFVTTRRGPREDEEE
jgi:ABC-2 type transport system ATP-binding protein